MYILLLNMSKLFEKNTNVYIKLIYFPYITFDIKNSLYTTIDHRSLRWILTNLPVFSGMDSLSSEQSSRCCLSGSRGSKGVNYKGKVFSPKVWKQRKWQVGNWIFLGVAVMVLWGNGEIFNHSASLGIIRLGYSWLRVFISLGAAQANPLLPSSSQ